MSLTIDGTNISTYGLQVSSVTGLHDLPKQKDILSHWNSSTDLIKLEEYQITIRLIGKYDTTGLMITAIENLRVKLASAVIHTYVSNTLNFTIAAVAKDGFTTRIYGPKYTMLELTLKITITQ
jgi:hypothetical protein